MSGEKLECDLRFDEVWLRRMVYNSFFKKKENGL